MKQLISLRTPLELDITTKTKIAAMLSSISEYNFIVSNVNEPEPEALSQTLLNEKNTQLLITASSSWEIT